MANLIVAQLLYLDSQDPETDITIYVNSPGGSVTAGMAIFDTMRHIRPACSTVCVGLAASMGAFLLASGRKGKRFSLPNSRIMIHQPLGGAQGQAADIEIQANEIMHHKATLNGYLAEFCGKPLERIMEDTDRDFFMGAQEAADYGLIDGVLSNERWKAFQQKGIPLYPVCACHAAVPCFPRLASADARCSRAQTRVTTLCSKRRAALAILVTGCRQSCRALYCPSSAGSVNTCTSLAMRRNVRLTRCPRGTVAPSHSSASRAAMLRWKRAAA